VRLVAGFWVELMKAMLCSKIFGPNEDRRDPMRFAGPETGSCMEGGAPLFIAWSLRPSFRSFVVAGWLMEAATLPHKLRNLSWMNAYERALSDKRVASIWGSYAWKKGWRCRV